MHPVESVGCREVATVRAGRRRVVLREGASHGRRTLRQFAVEWRRRVLEDRREIDAI